MSHEFELPFRATNDYRGREYPTNFEFFPNGHDPEKWEIVGIAHASNLKDTTEDVLVWDGSGVVRMSVSHLNRKLQS